MMPEPEPRAYACLLAGLPGMGPRRLTALLARFGPAEAWARAISGRPHQLAGAVELPGSDLERLTRSWAAAGAGADPTATLARHRSAGVQVLLGDDPGYPPALHDDVEPPAVLFALGDLACLAGPRVAIVGTRRCTAVGAGLSWELGRELAAAGVGIVSGLALGIDGAAHRGALAAGAERPGSACPIGIVGSGLDVVYPARHRDLWAAVAATGVLLSEAPLGARPTGWRFPARNRVIAALADVVVVIESHATGGSLHTVTEAERRGIPVLAAPGSVRSPAAAGTNQLIAEGCHPVRDATDVLVALGLTPAGQRGPVDRRPAPDPTGATVLEAFDWEPATLEHLAVRTGVGLPELALAVEALLAGGWIEAEGGWYERVAAR
jgi:DNA processing protein